MKNFPTDPYLIKIAQLLERLVHHLERYQASAAVSFQTNDVVRLEKSTLWVNKKSIVLEKREAILVSLLIEHARDVAHGAKAQFLPKSVLLDRIEEKHGNQWRYPISSDVDRVVATLRAKLEEKNISRDLIETRRSAGLRLSTAPGNISLTDPPN